jgi:flagellar biosynthesis activator protein FlaF
VNALQMARTAYSSAAAPIRTPRDTEYGAFMRVTQQLKAASEQQNKDYAAFVRALYDNRKLWTILAKDVADDDNGLSRDLRAHIFYLAEFTQLHSSKILGKTATVDALIEINTAIMRGLQQNGVAA